MPFTFYLLIWGARGYATDRTATFLVLLSFVISAVALVLLNFERIDPAQYAGFALAATVVVIALVFRWRRVERAAPLLPRKEGVA